MENSKKIGKVMYSENIMNSSDSIDQNTNTAMSSNNNQKLVNKNQNSTYQKMDLNVLESSRKQPSQKRRSEGIMINSNGGVIGYEKLNNSQDGAYSRNSLSALQSNQNKGNMGVIKGSDLFDNRMSQSLDRGTFKYNTQNDSMYENGLTNEEDDSRFRKSMFEQRDTPKLSILKGGRLPRNTQRIDRNGLPIDRQQKSYKISFADNINNGSTKLADVYLVESYKKFNAENTHGQQQGCCTIF